MSKNNTPKLGNRQKKHDGLTKKMGHALQKVTGKTQLDWAYMMNKFPHHRDIIKAHKNDQKFLAQLKKKLEK